MKKSLILSILLIILSLATFAQFPNKTGTSNAFTRDSTLGGRKGHLITYYFTDTGSANLHPYIKYEPDLIIKTGGDLTWQRSHDAKYWKLLGGGNIANPCPDYLIGSATWSGTGLIYDVTALQFNLPANPCINYSTTATTLTNAGADASYDRIDAIVADIFQSVYFVYGTPNSGLPPSTINPLTQKVVATVSIPRGSTTPAPTNITTTIYDEVLGSWGGSSTAGTIDFAATTPAPFSGAVSTLVTNPANGSTITWINPIGADDISNGQYLKLRIKLSATPTVGSTVLSVGFWNSATQSTNTFSISNGNYGMDYSSTGWQLITVPVIAPFGSTTADRIIFTISGAAAITFQLDKIYLLEGATPPATSSGLTWNQGGNDLTANPFAPFGTTSPHPVRVIVNGVETMVIPFNGIQRNDNGHLRVMVIDSANRNVYFRELDSIATQGCLKTTDSIGIKWIRDTCSHGTTYTADFPVVITGTVISVDTTAATPSALATQYDLLTYWRKDGDAGTTPGTNFLGTTDNVGFMFKANNVQSLYIDLVRTNTSIGRYALSNNTTGSNNTAIGESAMITNSTGDRNVAIGQNSRYSNTGGSSNTFIGSYSGSTATAPDTANTVIGSFSGATIAGSFNTIIGGSSGGFAQRRNVHIGYQVGNLFTPSQLTNKSIFIGNYINTAGTGVWTGAERMIVIGDSLNSLQVANSLNIGNFIYGIGLDGYRSTVSAGKIGFGTQTPDSAFHLIGGFYNTGGARMTGLPAGVGTKAVRWDEATGRLMVADTSSGGGSPLFPTTGTGTATGNVTGDMAGFDFTVNNGADELMRITPQAVNFQIIDAFSIQEGTDDLFIIDKFALKSFMKINDGTADASIELNGNSAGQVNFFLNANTGAQEVTILGDAVANTITLDAVETTATGNLTATKLIAPNVIGLTASEQTISFPAVAGTSYPLGIAESGGSLISLPTPVEGDVIYFFNYNSAASPDVWSTDQNLRLPNETNTSTLENNTNYVIQYTDARWRIVSMFNSVTGSGVYTPTTTDVTNITSSTPNQFTYSRVGNVVTYAGTITVVTTLAVSSQVDFSLPIASDLANANDLNGTGTAKTAIATNVVCEGDGTNDRASVYFIGLSVGGNGILYLAGQYVIK